MNTRKHDWASLQSYTNAHDRVLKTYQTHMDRLHVYVHSWPTPNYLIMECEGIILTTYQGNKVRVDINKDVEVDDSNPRRTMVQTSGYTYNAYKLKNGDLIRYDAPDPEGMITSATPDHHRFHHKHTVINGKETITLINDDEWPHVSEFFLEVLNTF